MTWESLQDALERLEAGMPPPVDAGLFGASIDPNHCQLVLIPVPWDATVSYGDGTAQGPAAILAASHQLDLEDAAFEKPYRCGITMLPPDDEIPVLNLKARQEALTVIAHTSATANLSDSLVHVNAASHRINQKVEALAAAHLDQRLVGVVGGDHSSPYGLIKALAEKYTEGFGILHFDAHFDLRKAYEGFTDSHASIMYNVMETLAAVENLVQVGIRDYSADESCYQRSLRGKSRAFPARDLFRRKARGETWDQITQDILSPLPQSVYISFDIDGLDPSYCPSTGTPVPGGLSFDEAVYILEALAHSGRRIIGFDLCEVAPGDGEWDANVGARILYKLCGAALASQGHCRRI